MADYTKEMNWISALIRYELIFSFCNEWMDERIDGQNHIDNIDGHIQDIVIPWKQSRNVNTDECWEWKEE